MGGVTAAYAHNERKKEAYKSNPDIAPERKPDNYHLVLPKQTYRREVTRMIKAAACRTRKDSTVMVEALITASPEFMQCLKPPEQREYFQRALSFVESKVGKDNIIAAVVHMDETTPHMHLSFCPLVDGKNGKSLSAKQILGNQATLSKWQDDFHACMSERFPELERGVSSMKTGRKHIPQSLFKLADRFDKQADKVITAINDIGAIGNAKKRAAAIELLRTWIPQAQGLTAKVHSVDDYVKSLESENRYQKNRNDDIQHTLVSERSGAKDKEWEHLQQVRALQERLRKAEALAKLIPPEVLEQIKKQKERGKSR
jgi:hypothetical protein